jgi:hypothetical protein
MRNISAKRLSLGSVQSQGSKPLPFSNSYLCFGSHVMLVIKDVIQSTTNLRGKKIEAGLIDLAKKKAD